MINQHLTRLFGIRPGDIRQIDLGGPIMAQLKGDELWVRMEAVFDDSARDIQERLWNRLGIIAGIGVPVQDGEGMYWQPFLVIGFNETSHSDREPKPDGREGKA